MQNFNKIYSIIKGLPKSELYIPSVWYDGKVSNTIEKINFNDYLLSQFDKIIANRQPFTDKTTANIFNILVRYTTAFNHYDSEQIINEECKFKTTGTFLKTIALLPYIKQLGADILYLLPITSIGKDGMKGNLGSPYSIFNPYSIDPNLSEPLLGISVEEQFAALIEAAHHIGIKIVCEFIFRTASKDSILAIEHPEWFYWIKSDVDNFSSPEFPADELSVIRQKVESNDFNNLPEPNIDYQLQFTQPPEKVELIDGKIVGICKDGTCVKIPGAFADYPPDDTQPAWTDVTYLKLYDNPKFNYMAYNTLRMYDYELTEPCYEVTPLWRYIENIIPYYQNQFGIDGVMIDMGHALPANLLSRIISKARRNNKDFLVWEENFIPTENSVQKGFNLVLGFIPFDQHNCDKMRNCIENIQYNTYPIGFFATPETHNTPRFATRKRNIKFSRIAYITNSLLPIPTFIHSGFELCETTPVNTGLGFENIDISEWTPDKLPLFSNSIMNWKTEENLIDFIKNVNEVVEKWLNNDENIKNNTIKPVECITEYILAFIRRTKNPQQCLLFIANYSDKPTTLSLELPTSCKITQLLGDGHFVHTYDILTLSMDGLDIMLLLVDNLNDNIHFKEIFTN